MRLTWSDVALLSLFATAAIALDNPSAAVSGAYQPADKELLASSFVDAVNVWLQRYEQTLITQNPEYVRMQVRYDYVYDLELIVKDDHFEIKVTGSERARGMPNGQRNATNLAAGILERMKIRKRRRSEYKDRW